jgi:hypothetical protein
VSLLLRATILLLKSTVSIVGVFFSVVVVVAVSDFSAPVLPSPAFPLLQEISISNSESATSERNDFFIYAFFFKMGTYLQARYLFFYCDLTS